MQTIKILCLECDKSFDFRHPSVNNSKDIGGATLTCPNCNQDLVRADYTLAMESVHTKIRRQLTPVIGKEAAEAAEVHTIECLPDTTEVKVPQRVPISPAPPINLPRSPLADNEALAALKKKLEG